MNWDAIRKEYESSDITLKALAEKHEIKLGTLKSRKSREGWERDATATPKKVATPKKDATPKKPIKEVFVESDELTDKQRLFCLYYMKYFSATKAYQKAYNCNYNTANAEGYKLLVKPCIKEEITRMKEERATEINLQAKDVLQKYIDIAFADITDFLTFGRETEVEMVDTGQKDSNGNPIYKEEEHSFNYVRFKDHEEVDGTIISEVKQGKDGVSIKLADKMRALEFLTKHFDMAPDMFKRRIEEEKLKLAQQKAGSNDGDTQENEIADMLRKMVDRDGA
ncbi:terminase small subunit [Priestia megaterium]|uniref:terminase small subunit n=1 Tax=Priestia megaterium TaxID=1404 RepID=UPI002E1C4277|nr:terminase small subunit [Priestia megaterium]